MNARPIPGEVWRDRTNGLLYVIKSCHGGSVGFTRADGTVGQVSMSQWSGLHVTKLASSTSTTIHTAS